MSLASVYRVHRREESGVGRKAAGGRKVDLISTWGAELVERICFLR